MKNQIIKIIVALVLSFTIFSCEDEGTNDQIKVLPTILEIAQSQPENFSILIAALKKTGLDVNVSSGGSYTVFAPVNTAFTGLYTEAGINALNPAVPADFIAINSLRRILQNHILGVGTKADDLLASGYVRTFATGQGTSTLSMLIKKVGADVIINGGATNGGAKVTTPNIDASNGIVHVVDNVIKLPTLINQLTANGNFTKLLAAATSGVGGPFGNQAAIATALSANGPSTLFAPLDSAFDTALATSGYLKGTSFDFTADNALATANITKVLQYHVSSGNLTSSSSTSWNATTLVPLFSEITTLLAVVPPTTPVATFQKFRIEKGTVKILENPVQTGVPVSNIKTVNIQATNGVIHTIDRVLQPVL